MSDMSIDEAIADAVRQVPECAEGVQRAFYLGVCTGPTEQIERAIWFHAAYTWLASQGSIQDGHGGTFLPHRSTQSGQWRDGQYDEDEPTEYHALRAAVLLAKGLKP